MDERPRIERITIEVRLPGKEPIQYVLQGEKMDHFCGIGWEPSPAAPANKVVQGNVFAFLQQLAGGAMAEKGAAAAEKWGTPLSPLPAFLVKLPDCNSVTPKDVWGY
jgi:hypothetical protein